MRTRRFVIVMEPGQRRIGALETRGLWTSRLLPGRVERGVCYVSSWADVCQVLRLSNQVGWSVSGEAKVWALARPGPDLGLAQCVEAMAALTPHAWWEVKDGDIDGAQVQAWIEEGVCIFLTSLAGGWTCAIESQGRRVRMGHVVEDPYEAYLWGFGAIGEIRGRRSA